MSIEAIRSAAIGMRHSPRNEGTLNGKAKHFRTSGRQAATGCADRKIPNLRSQSLIPIPIQPLGDIGRTTVETESEFRRDPKGISLFGLFGATKDEDVQRGLGFLTALARNIGRMMRK